MSDQPSPAYRVVAAERVRNQIKYWARAAMRADIMEAFEANLEAMFDHLAHRPLTWGDPLYRLRAMKLLVCHGMTHHLNVYYAVDELRKIVYLQEIRLLPNIDLD